jgi:hypothetical protein
MRNDRQSGGTLQGSCSLLIIYGRIRPTAGPGFAGLRAIALRPRPVGPGLRRPFGSAHPSNPLRGRLAFRCGFMSTDSVIIPFLNASFSASYSWLYRSLSPNQLLYQSAICLTVKGVFTLSPSSLCASRIRPQKNRLSADFLPDKLRSYERYGQPDNRDFLRHQGQKFHTDTRRLVCRLLASVITFF